jgi:hypothetical protein
LAPRGFERIAGRMDGERGLDCANAQRDRQIERRAGAERQAAGNAGPMIDLLDNASASPVTKVDAAFLTVTVPPQTVMVLKPRERPLGGYSRYKRVR